MNIVYSKNKVPIRLTEERWVHITEEHNEIAGYYFEVLEVVSNPEAIYKGKEGEYIAVRPMEERKYLIVIYREISEEDGFIITAFITRRIKYLERRQKL